MNELWVQLLITVLSASGVGGLIVVAVTEAWRERRANNRKDEEERRADRRAEQAGAEAAERVLQDQGIKRITDLETRLTSAEDKASHAEERANKAEERANKAAERVRVVEENQRKRTIELEALQQEHVRIAAERSDTLARLEREAKARFQAEEVLKVEVNQKLALTKRVTELEEELNKERGLRERLEAEVTEAKRRITELESLLKTPPPASQ